MPTESKEILSAEVFLDSLGPKVATADIDAELGRIERELQAYKCEAGMEDYALAVLCGILSGAVDAFLLKQVEITAEGITAAPGQILGCLQKAADKGKKTETAPTFKHVKVKKGFAEALPELTALSRHATGAGVVSGILRQFSDSGLFRFDGEKLQPFPEGMDRNNVICVAGAGVAAGVMKWLFNAAPDADAEGSLKTIGKLHEIMHASPAMAEIVKCVDKWQKQLPGEILGFKKANQREMRVDEVFASLLSALSVTKALEGTRLPAFMEYLRRVEGMGITRIPLAGALSAQAMPVVLNEIMVRTVYFATRLAKELAAHEDVSQIDWDGVVPFGHRTIERMIAVASTTFTVADTMDAIVHAAVESAGNGVLFSGTFVKRYNYVAYGRAAVAVYREIAAERAEAELIHEKRLLTEARTARVMAQLDAYRQQLEARVSEYLAEDLTAFLEGFSAMDAGLQTGDSNRVIRGNVVIQRVLGREPQFTNQQEFDDLMDSDIPLKL